MDPMTPSDTRRDFSTAVLIDHGLAIQQFAGPGAAYKYLVQRGVPVATIKRVLSDPGGRRPVGPISIAPMR